MRPDGLLRLRKRGLGLPGSRKAGLPPGSLVHVGEQKTPHVRIHVIDYDERRVEEHADIEAGACEAFRASPGVSWIDVVGLHDPDVVGEMGAIFGLHPLVQEDILNTNQRPKVEVYDDYVYVVIRMFMPDAANGSMTSEQVSIIIGKGFLISFQEAPGDVFEGVRTRIRTGKARIRKSGPDYLAYALMDGVIDRYFVILDDLGQRISLLEDEVLTDPRDTIQHEIYLFKRELLTLRKMIWPLREMTSVLQRTESGILEPGTAVYLRDLYDHSVQVLDAVETMREITLSLMDIYLSSLSNRMNAIMKVLTMIATIFIPLTFIAGVYGMNFEFMPELGWKWAYPAVLLVMALLTLVMVIYFRRKRWF